MTGLPENKFKHLTSEDCFIEVSDLVYDKEELLKQLKLTQNWSSGDSPSKNYLFTTTGGLSKMHNIIQEQFPEFELEGGYFIQLKAQTYAFPHIDIVRTATIIIPLMGNMDQSPLFFHTKKSSLPQYMICKHIYKCPTIINTGIWHSSFNMSDENRYHYSINIINKEWDEIKKIMKSRN